MIVILPWISRTPGISNVSRVPMRGLVSVYHCNFTLDILNPRYLERKPCSHAWTCKYMIVILLWISRTPGISNLSRVPMRGLVSVYHCNFTLDILNPRYLERKPCSHAWTCKYMIVILPWISRTPGISNVSRVPMRGLVSI